MVGQSAVVSLGFVMVDDNGGYPGCLFASAEFPGCICCSTL